MKIIGNILWFVLAGFWLFCAYLIAGILQCITVIGIPFGLRWPGCSRTSNANRSPYTLTVFGERPRRSQSLR